jgi:hypothetical protein
MIKQYYKRQCNHCGKKLNLFEGKTLLTNKNELILCEDCFKKLVRS